MGNSQEICIYHRTTLLKQNVIMLYIKLLPNWRYFNLVTEKNVMLTGFLL